MAGCCANAPPHSTIEDLRAAQQVIAANVRRDVPLGAPAALMITSQEIDLAPELKLVGHKHAPTQRSVVPTCTIAAMWNWDTIQTQKRIMPRRTYTTAARVGTGPNATFKLPANVRDAGRRQHMVPRAMHGHANWVRSCRDADMEPKLPTPFSQTRKASCRA